MDEDDAEIVLMPKPSPQARFGIFLSLGCLIGLVAVAVAFGRITGNYEQEIASEQIEIKELKESKADKEMIAEQNTSIQKQLERLEKGQDELRNFVIYNRRPKPEGNISP